MSTRVVWYIVLGVLITLGLLAVGWVASQFVDRVPYPLVYGVVALAIFAHLYDQFGPVRRRP